MSFPADVDRRTLFAGAAGALGLRALTPGAARQDPAPAAGRLRQSVARWCYPKIQLADLCREAKAMGLESVELLGEKEWGVVREHGLTCAVANGPGPIHEGWNRIEHHDRLVAESERLLPLVKDAGIPNLIVFSGNRKGMDDEQGIANCVLGLKRVVGLAEKLGVTLVMELLNSKVDHKDYLADRTSIGIRIVQGVASPRFRLLYDIYHMQIMEGDVIRTIRAHKDAIAHYHTGGVPGRNEIDETQELNYRAIAQAIADTGFTGFVAHEFLPRRDPFTSLRQAQRICDLKRL
ncbi:MAG: TIM barrel protein [Planctomycetes bacterium]|nr:TIM barrel protein [Planctomycetota bacterium]